MNVEEQDEHLPDVRHEYLPATVKDWIDPTCEHVIDSKGRSCNKSYQVRQGVVFASIWIDIGKAIRRKRSSKTRCQTDDCIEFEHFPFHEALGRAERSRKE